MDGKTIIAFALMLLIYFYFFQPKTPPAHISTNSISAVAPTPSVIEQKKSSITQSAMTVPTADVLAAKTLTLKNNKVEIEMNGLGQVKTAKFIGYGASLKTKDEIKYVFTPKDFNRSELYIGEAIEWKMLEERPDGFILESARPDRIIQRKISISPDSYILNYEDVFQNKSTQAIKVGSFADLFYFLEASKESPSFLMRIFHPQAEIHEIAIYQDGSVFRKMFGSIEAPIEKIEPISWTGFSDKYFFFGLVPKNFSVTKVTATPRKVDAGQEIQENIVMAQKQIEPGETSSYSYALYLGPKQIPELEKANPELPRVIDYGDWLGPIARFLLTLLHFFYKLIPNYGIGIILLTILVKLALYPLSYKSAVSMRKLQLVQPKMKEIRDKYKDDKQKMNTEMMALYRNEKVNPVGGCLPLLIQMPIFFALYRVFFSSIEFRHAPFFGWIKDLSAHDPYFIIPVLMTALMWYQQKITPVPPAAEETEAIRMQRTMMKWMPIFFGAIMLFLPSGLTLYFLINALTSIIQQFYFNKKLGAAVPAK